MSVLKGIRVLDFGRYVAGPYCATLLGYLGAQVIRIERIGGGEDRFIAPVTACGRGRGAPADRLQQALAGAGFPQARVRRDRAPPGGRALMSWWPTCRRRRLPRSALTTRLSARVRPQIILATQSAFGDAGPYQDRGGFDGVGQAMSGAMYITGSPGNPAKAAAPYVDYTTAVLAAFGTLAALLHKNATGEGQEVKTTLLGTALAVFGSHLIEQSVTGINRAGSGNRVQTSAPSDVFATADGHVLTHTVGDALFRRWARLMGEEQRWVSDPLYATDQSRGDHSAAILERMRAWCATRTTAEALAQLTAAGLPAGPVLTPAAGAG